MKIQFEAEMKNAEELTRFFREIEKSVNSATLSSEGFTKSMIDGIEAIQKATSTMGSAGGMKKSLEEFGQFKDIAKESADVLQGYFVDAAKKAEMAAGKSFVAIGHEVKKLTAELKAMGAEADGYAGKMAELQEKTAIWKSASSNQQAAQKERQKLEGTSVIELGGKAATPWDNFKGRMNTGYGRAMQAQFGDKGTMGFGDWKAKMGGGAMGGMGAAGMYATAGVGAFIAGVGVARQGALASIEYGRMDKRREVAAQRMAIGGLEGSLGGDYSETMAEMYGRTGRVRGGNTTKAERVAMGTSRFFGWFTGKHKTDEQLFNEQALDHLGVEKEMYKHYSTGMKHRVRVSTQFRAMGQTFGDQATGQYADIAKGQKVGQQAMDQMFGMFQANQMQPDSSRSSLFYQGMKSYGVSGDLMGQMVRMQRSGTSFNSKQAGNSISSMIAGAGLKDPDIAARQYLTGAVGQAMAANSSDTYAMGEAGRIIGAAGAANAKFGDLNSLYVTQNAVGAMNNVFAPVKKDGSYENSLMREQLRSMGLDSTSIDLWFKTGGPSNASAMEDMAGAFDLTPTQFRNVLYKPIKAFKEEQMEIMGGATGNARHEKWMANVRTRWVDNKVGTQTEAFKKRYGGSILTEFSSGGKDYSNDQKGYEAAARDKLAKQSLGIDAYTMGQQNNVDQSAVHQEAYDIDMFGKVDGKTGKRISRGARTDGESQEEMLGKTMGTLMKAITDPTADSIFSKMNTNLELIAQKIAPGAAAAGQSDDPKLLWNMEGSMWDNIKERHATMQKEIHKLHNPEIKSAQKTTDKVTSGAPIDIGFDPLAGTGLGKPK